MTRNTPGQTGGLLIAFTVSAALCAGEAVIQGFDAVQQAIDHQGGAETHAFFAAFLVMQMVILLGLLVINSRPHY